MCTTFEDFGAEERRKGKVEGELEIKVNMIIKAVRTNKMSLNEAFDFFDLSKGEFNNYIKEHNIDFNIDTNSGASDNGETNLF